MPRHSFIHMMFIAVVCSVACTAGGSNDKRIVSDYINTIPGQDEVIDEASMQRGKVLIAYGDCYTCHKENDRAFGPAFNDIALRYPAKKVFIQLLAQKIISGGKGSWGNAVMLPHPKLSLKDAEDMATYVLSLDQ